MSTSSTMKNSTQVNVEKITSSNRAHFYGALSWEPQPICGSQEDVPAISTTPRAFALLMLCLVFSLINNFNLSCLNKQFSKHSYSTSKVASQFLAEWIHTLISNASNVLKYVLWWRMFCKKSQIRVGFFFPWGRIGMKKGQTEKVEIMELY